MIYVTELSIVLFIEYISDLHSFPTYWFDYTHINTSSSFRSASPHTVALHDRAIPEASFRT